MKVSRFTPFAMAIGIASLAVACGDDDDPGTTPGPVTQSNTIVDVARAAGDFDTLVGALEATGLDATLSGPGPFTVFAPTDDAFARLPDGVVASLSATELSQVLTYHVVSGSVDSATVVGLSSATTVEGSDAAIKVVDGSVVINGVIQVTAVDIQADNGIIHVIDAVLLPPSWSYPGTVVDAAAGYPIFDTLVSAVVAGDLAATLSAGTWTVFAPTNAAFADLPAGTIESLLDPANIADLQNVLTYHAIAADVPSTGVVALATAETAQGARVRVQAGSMGVMVNDASVTWTDIRTSNGTLHVIDSVLIPPADVTAVAADAGSFSTLLSAIDSAGLTSVLQGPGPFTVFAPTDEAFAKLSLSGDLSDVLTYHVLSGIVDSKDVVALAGSMDPRATTLSGVSDNQIAVSTRDGKVFINSYIQVVSTDIVAGNGIIHEVDSVMLPSSVPFPGNVVGALSAYPAFESLVEAVVSADLAAALQTDNSGNGFTVFAPTNAAFAALGIDVASLSQAELADILLYHVVGSTVDAATVVGLTSAATLQGSSVDIEVVDGSVMLNGSTKVIWTDVRADNGIIHVIDAVLLPPAA